MRLLRYYTLYIVGSLQIIWLVLLLRQHKKQHIKHRGDAPQNAFNNRHYGQYNSKEQWNISSGLKVHITKNAISNADKDVPEPDTVNDILEEDRKNDLEGNFLIDSQKLNSEAKGTEGNTMEFNKDIVVYNRLAKCGSTTLMKMVEKYSNVTYKNDYNKSTSDFKEVDIVNLVQSLQTPAFYVRHCKFINFTEYGYKQPIFIQMVRDPIKRAISHFYYTKWHFHLIREEMTLGDCLQLQLKENSSFEHCKVVAKFSWHSFCSESVLQENKCSISHVKTIMEKYYMFIGIMEHYEESIEALSQMLPHLFARNIPIEPENSAIKAIKHDNPKPSAITLELLKQTLASEYIVYDFAKQLFYDKLKKLGIRMDSKDT